MPDLNLGTVPKPCHRPARNLGGAIHLSRRTRWIDRDIRTASSSGRRCPGTPPWRSCDDGIRQRLGNTPIQTRTWKGYWSYTTLGSLYVGWIPSCRRAYAEVSWNNITGWGPGNRFAGGTIYLNDEYGNSVGRAPFSPDGQGSTNSGPVTIDAVPVNSTDITSSSTPSSQSAPTRQTRPASTPPAR
ncbi:hypothetical protein [Streptomyces sp. NBC_01006]|uniref:hypothetical protein n=1 Tax=Streptomyces sp. NBC_01006 TaxID=2903716 RepID=UPI0038691757|nr:hypothetical protein OG509_39350 [Streptomyces sp. NBC_01006]